MALNRTHGLAGPTECRFSDKRRRENAVQAQEVMERQSSNEIHANANEANLESFRVDAYSRSAMAVTGSFAPSLDPSRWRGETVAEPFIYVHSLV